MLELKNDRLTFSFPEVHPDAICHIEFQRTLRIPDDNREYPLPAGLGCFPLLHVDDYAPKLPASWRSRGGVFLPMYQAEAMWVNFVANGYFRSAAYPFAVKIAAGKINAVTGEPWVNELSRGAQDYLVAPDQPWIDGFCVQKGLIRQFVAMPLGAGYTAEGQLTGREEVGGLQIIVYPMKAERYAKIRVRPDELVLACAVDDREMGLAPGGLMRQELYEDPYGRDAWETTAHSRCFVHILNSLQYAQVTGRKPPTEPLTTTDYSEAGIPWFDYYAEGLTPLPGGAPLSNLDSVAATGIKKGQNPLPGNEPVKVEKVTKLGGTAPGIRDGKW